MAIDREAEGVPQITADIAVFAKAPVPGEAKTRLIPALGAAGAARLQRRLTRHALHVAQRAGLGAVTLWCAPDTRHRFFRALARCEGVDCRPQPDGDLGARMGAAFENQARIGAAFDGRARMAAAFERQACMSAASEDPARIRVTSEPSARMSIAFEDHARMSAAFDARARKHPAFEALDRRAPLLVIGTDCPALTVTHLRDAARALQAGVDAVLLPAEDGGYVLVGLRRPMPALFDRIDWGTDRVMSQTRERLASIGATWHEGPTLWDIDRPGDLPRLAGCSDA